MSKDTKKDDGFQKGFPVVVGPRDAAQATCGREWTAVMADAEAGLSGLRLTDERALFVTSEQFQAGVRGYQNYNVLPGEFAARRIHAFGQSMAGLFLQNW